MHRRAFLQSLAADALTSAAPAALSLRTEVAVTIDDFTLSQAWPQSPSQVNRALLGVLERHRLRTTLFVTASNLAEPDAGRLLNEWVEAGHVIGNHTYSHRILSTGSTSLSGFADDVLRAEKFLQPFSTYEHIFRFPALKEGNTLALRDGMRSFLADHGYRNGRVTIDASDWYYSQRLQSRLRAEPAFDVGRFRSPYVEHIRSRSLYYDALARQILGRSPKHTLLLHYSFLNAEYLSDICHMYRSLNWRLISATEAFNDPVFGANPNILPAGESLIWALAKQTGQYDSQLRYPGEDGRYEAAGLDRLGL